jgi:hypothetical protein
MRNLILSLISLISLPIAAQNWAAIGNFNQGIGALYVDTTQDELYIGGTFCFYDSDTLVGIAKWNGNSMTTLGCGVEWDCITPGISGNSPPVNGIVRFNNELYATGSFDKAGNKIVNGLTKWDGSNWNNIGTGLKDSGGNMGIGLGLKIINNELYVFGMFDSIAGTAANSIARFNGTTWSAVNNFPLMSSNLNDKNSISDIAQYNNELYVCGIFYNPQNPDLSNIAKWDGFNWVRIGNGIEGGITFLSKMIVYKNELYVGGYFSQSIYNPGNNIIRWNGTQWHDLQNGTDAQIRDMFVHNDILYVCGSFSHAGGISAEYIATWDSTKWCGFGSTFDNVIGALEFYHDTLFIGGGFWTIDGDSMHRMAKWIGGIYIDTCSSPLGINEINNNENSVTLCPNPFDISATLKLSKTIHNVTLTIYDILGNEVKRLQNLNGSEMQITRDGLKSGMYFYNLIDSKGLIGNGKIIIE